MNTHSRGPYLESARSLAIFACLPSSSSSSSSQSKSIDRTDSSVLYASNSSANELFTSHVQDALARYNNVPSHCPDIGNYSPDALFPCRAHATAESSSIVLSKDASAVLLSSLSRSSRLDFLPIQLLRHRTILRPQKFFNLRLIHVVQTPINLSRSGMSVLLRNLL